MSDGSDGEAFDRGHVVWHDGLFRTAGRPWIVLSDDHHPFHGEEYLVAGVTTTERTATIPLPDDAWAVGGLPKTSYASPWYVTTLRHADIDRGIGGLTDSIAATLLEETRSYLGDE